MACKGKKTVSMGTISKGITRLLHVSYNVVKSPSNLPTITTFKWTITDIIASFVYYNVKYGKMMTLAEIIAQMSY